MYLDLGDSPKLKKIVPPNNPLEISVKILGRHNMIESKLIHDLLPNNSSVIRLSLEGKDVRLGYYGNNDPWIAVMSRLPNLRILDYKTFPKHKYMIRSSSSYPINKRFVSLDPHRSPAKTTLLLIGCLPLQIGMTNLSKLCLYVLL